MGKRYAVILAGGSGVRAGGDVPKQFRLLRGLPVVWWSVKRFFSVDPSTEIRIVMHPGFFDLWDALYSSLPEEDKRIKIELICGGRNRLESVKNGIAGIDMGNGSETLIAVHDAARPLVDTDMISRGWETAERFGTAIPVAAMTDSIRKIMPTGSVALDRSQYVRVQTPQVFHGDILKRAYSRTLLPEMTDDASVVEAAGEKIVLYDGSENNIKITNPIDFKIAEILMK